jgi:hypothetical protein
MMTALFAWPPPPGGDSSAVQSEVIAVVKSVTTHEQYEPASLSDVHEKSAVCVATAAGWSQQRCVGELITVVQAVATTGASLR